MKTCMSKRIFSSFGLLIIVVAALDAMQSVASAQATIGEPAGTNQMSVDFYKVPPGKQDEWLALYKKYHFPIMKYEKEHGQVISETIYKRNVHELNPNWDFAIILIQPPASVMPKSELTRSQLIRRLFPDLADYVKGEKARWALTVAHWDESWSPVDIDNHPSLFEPY